MPALGYHDQNPENNMFLLMDWLDNCRRNHPKCYKIKDKTDPDLNFTPTRLLDLQAYGSSSSSSSSDKSPFCHLGTDVRVVCLNGSSSMEYPPAYFTLSHCWGPPEKRPATTTKANLAQRMDSIPFSELPKTFQDAIEITRKIGARYLWIDSLCIVQDDEHDWAREAGLMAKVYSHSSCTLSALSSKDSSEGLRLEPLDEDRSFVDVYCAECNFNYQHQHQQDSGHSHDRRTGRRRKSSSDNDPYPFRFRLFYSLNDDWNFVYRGDARMAPNENSPLRSRAWTLQEQQLSRRIIHFAKNQVLWECAELKATAQRPWRHDDFPALKPEREWKEWEGIVAKGKHDRDLAATASSVLSSYLSQRKWWEMVLDYSQRLLSNETDKLAALSGMAQFFHKNHFPDDRYVAGMWSSRLEQEIFWSVDNQVGPDRQGRRPEEYVAPSWSWASVNGRITFWQEDPVKRLKMMMGKQKGMAAWDSADAKEEKDNEDLGKDNTDTWQDYKNPSKQHRDSGKDNRHPGKFISEGWKLEDVTVLPRYYDPYGALQGGSLIISGARLVEVELITDVHIEPNSWYVPGSGGVEFTRHYNGLLKDGQWVADHSLDVPGEAAQSRCRLWCWGILAEVDHRKRPVMEGLLLKKEENGLNVDEDGGLCIYSWVGKFHDMKVEWFEGVETRRIKLI